MKTAPTKDVGPGFASFLSREMFCKASCHWQWFAEREGGEHYVGCQSCGSSYPWRDSYYLQRIYEAERGK